MEARHAARDIVRGLTLTDFQRAVAGLRDVDDINMLISVGLRQSFMEALLERAKEAREERGRSR